MRAFSALLEIVVGCVFADVRGLRVFGVLLPSSFLFASSAVLKEGQGRIGQGSVVDEAETRLWSIKVADIACGLCSGQRRPEVRV